MGQKRASLAESSSVFEKGRKFFSKLCAETQPPARPSKQGRTQPPGAVVKNYHSYNGNIPESGKKIRRNDLFYFLRIPQSKIPHIY